MMRPTQCQIFLTDAEWADLDPVVPANVYAVSFDTVRSKLGDGSTRWSSLPFSTSILIVNKSVQTSREPVDEEMLLFCASEDKWLFKLIGCILSQTNFTGAATTVYPKYALIVEKDNSTGIPTGRFKIADGVNELGNIHWAGPIDLTDLAPVGFVNGDSIEFNGTSFVAQKFVHDGVLQVATSPTGKFHRDDGTWAGITTLPDLTDVYSTAGAFVTVYVGGKSGEANTVTLTSNGTLLYVDGIEVVTVGSGGSGSGLDSDTVDGLHASQIKATAILGPVSAVENNFVSFGATPQASKDSGKSASSFANASHTHAYTDITENVVVGPVTSVSGNLSTFGDTDGDTLTDSGETIAGIKSKALMYAIALGG